MSRIEHLADGVTMVLGDCLEVLPTLTGITHVLTDPPYEDELHNALARSGWEGRLRNDGGSMPNVQFAGINACRDDAAKAIVRAANGWIVAFTLAEGVRAWRDSLQAAGARYDTCLAWIRPDASPRFNGEGAARGFECMATAWCGPGYKQWNGGGRRGVFWHPANPPGRLSAKDRGHPTEKPLALMGELVSLYTDPGDLIADPFCGSGSTGVACVKAGRRFVGIEIDPKWFTLSCRRLEAALRQGDLFVGRPSGKPKQEAFAW
jgi:site-specific DNA-methyltransferase (adenine-specific)